MNYPTTNPTVCSIGIRHAAIFNIFCLKWIYLFVLVFSISTQAQPPAALWKKTLGGIGIEHSNDMIRTLDGGLLIAASNESNNNGDVTGNHGGADAWVVKLDASGNIVWQKSYGGSDAEFSQNVIQAADGGYFITGLTSSNDGDVSGNHGSYDVWVIRIDAVGTIVWQKTYGGAGAEQTRDAIVHPNGDLLISGFTDSNDGDVSGNHGNSDFWLLRINQSGGIVSQKCFGGSGDEIAYGMGLSADGGIVMTGSSSSVDGDATGNPLGGCAWTIKTDLSATLLWQKHSPRVNTGEAAGNAVATTDDGVMVAGLKSIDGSAKIWVVRYDENGNQLWEKYYGGVGQSIANVVKPMIDGGFIVGGQTWTNPPDGVNRNAGNFWIMKIGVGGVMIWDKIMGGIADEYVTTLLVDPDGSLIASGPSYSNDGDVSSNHGSTDIWIVKLDVDTALPVTLISFTALPKDNASVELEWVTANEQENAYFKIEKSKDLKEVIAVTSIVPDKGAENTHAYRHVDELPFQGTSYYRLKQVDLDGKTTTYAWRAVVLNRDYAVFPNPGSAGRFHLRVDEPLSALIQLYDISGRLVPARTLRSETGIVEVKITVQSRPGPYLLQVTERGQTRMHRVIMDK